MSSPDSTIVVHTSTSAAPRRKSSITCSSSPSAIWPCATSTRALRHHRPHALGGLVDRVHAVVEEEGLALPLQLALDRAPDELLVVVAHVGLHGPPALGRRLDHRDVAQAGQRHLERPRDRRGRQREHVHAQPQLAQQLLLLDAEALLLVHDQEAEVLRPHVAGEQAVGADHHVHLARGEARERVAHLLGGAEARGHLDRAPGSRACAR